METAKIRVAVAGATGRMGREVVRTILGQSDMELVAAVDHVQLGKDIGNLAGTEPIGVAVRNDLEQALKETRAQVMVDFTNPLVVMGNIQVAAKCKVAGVVGTTGLTADNLREIQERAEKNGVGFLVAPNFALGAILMMRFAKQAAAYLPNVEIIELHHDQKMDAPSGTALKTVEMIVEGRRGDGLAVPTAMEKVKGSRGGEKDGIHLHSIRLPGLVAHQEVIFGGQGQTLTIRHDSLNRESFMPGVMLAVRRVLSLPGLTYGLEHILD